MEVSPATKIFDNQLRTPELQRILDDWIKAKDPLKKSRIARSSLNRNKSNS